jgi:hypothetical protein
MQEPPEKEVDICTVLRGIYHGSADPSIRVKARVATAMAKKMDMKLREYKKMFALGGTDASV